MVKAVHVAVSGRARFKVKGLYRSEGLGSEIGARLSSYKGIEEASVNVLTGNVLVYYHSINAPSEIASVIEGIARDYFRQNNGNGGGSNNGNNGSRTSEKRPARMQPVRQHSGERAVSRRRLRQSVVHAKGQQVEEWHLKATDEALTAFATSKQTGLSVSAAGENLKRFGPNLLPESVPRSGLSIFLEQFKSLPVALLGAAAGISIVTGGLADAVVIAGVVLINSAIGYTTEVQTEKTINALKSLVRPSAAVRRDGNLMEIGADEVVPGDILVLRPGSYLTADARLLEATHLSVDESALTGESMPVTKKPGRLRGEEIPLADRTNMVYMGTLVTGGQGLAVVVATGRYTEIGMIQHLVGEARPPQTPMERQLNTMGTQLVVIAGGICGLVFVIGLLRGYGLLEMLKTSISLAVAAVPEGLPTVATTTLALGIRSMRKRNVLIRHLNAVETLGSVQTICLDKTGTITLNSMSVVAAYAGTSRYKVSQGKFFTAQEQVNPYNCDELLKLIHISVLCNESEIIQEQGKFIVNGSPTENALIHTALSSGIDVRMLKEKFPLLEITHRSENRNYMYTIHATQNNVSIAAVKGSPTEVFSLCSWYMKDGERLPLTDDERLLIQTENERMAGEALRILGVAYSFVEDRSRITGQDGELMCELTWVGLVGMADPVREGVKGLINEFHKAGIDTVMITGDQSPTAYAIGKELNLSNNGHLEILDSTHLSNIQPDVMRALCERVHVFARVSPAHKLQIVQALQGAGKIVAMTGDGINDGPALKAADIGIAMGHTGTDVAREVADVVIEDDNLETMIIAISQGRTIYNNIRKSVHFLLSTNLSEIMVMFTAIAGGLGQPLNAIQLLWINLMSDIAPGLALALEPPEPDVLSAPPRNPHEPIVRKADFKRIAFESAVISAGSLAAYGYGISRYGMGPRAGSLEFLSLTSGQLLHALSCRSEKHSIFDRGNLPQNRYLNMALAGSFGIQALSMLVPGLRNLLGIAPIGLLDGAVLGASAIVPLLVNEATKKGMGETAVKGNEENTGSSATDDEEILIASPA